MTEIKTDRQILGQLGNLKVKIADNAQEIESAQRLRHRVFIADRGNNSKSTLNQKDEDRFDAFCDHLIVFEEAENLSDPTKVVATYRLMSQEQAQKAGGYYTASEFAVEKLSANFPDLKFLELGRSCVLPEYRTKRTIELLWHGSWAYVRKHGFDVMFGCASFEGTDPKRHCEALSFLYENACADETWNVPGLGEVIDLAGLTSDNHNPKNAIRALPPLIKGYLRLGAMFASEAVIDRQFNTIDVLVLLPVAKLNPRYVKYYGENAERHA